MFSNERLRNMKSDSEKIKLNVNKTICKRCGKCCLNPCILALHHVPFDKDNQELGKWLSYHGYQPFKIYNGKEDVLGVKLSGKCEHLETKDNLVYSCKIYENRPQICKDHWCKEHNLLALVDKKAMELVQEEKCTTSLSKE